MPIGPEPGTDLTQDMILHGGLLVLADQVTTFATNLNGSITWYYDSVTGGIPSYFTSLEPGGDMLLIGHESNVPAPRDWLREIDLAGDTVRLTNVDAINAQLAIRGQLPIFNFNHDVELLPNGDLAVLANTQRTINVAGTPTVYKADIVLVLDKNLQIVWDWDPFQWLDTNRLPTLGEGADDWLHANTIGWSPADGDLTVSLRSQDWVIKIDYSNGNGDGHVIWKLGVGGDFTINSSDPSPWFSHQHDVRYINDTTIVLYDNGNVRHATDSTANSRGQELVLNEATMQATLVVNADMGNYSGVVGSAAECSPMGASPSTPVVYSEIRLSSRTRSKCSPMAPRLTKC